MDSNNMPTVEDIRSAFGIPNEPENNPPADDESSTGADGAGTDQNVGAEDNNPDSGASGTDSETKPEDQPKDAEGSTPPPSNPKSNADNAKQAQAFARMRTENAAMQKTMSMMAQILGVDPKLPSDQLTQQLQDKARNAFAKQQNIDPQILQRLDQLEQINSEYAQIKLQQKANTAFQNIQEKYGATQDDLTEFVNGLIKEDFDMSAPGADLESEFLKRNFDAIIKNKVDAAVAAEQARAAKAGGASNPGGKQGQEDSSEPHAVNSVADLNEFLNKYTNQ